MSFSSTGQSNIMPPTGDLTSRLDHLNEKNWGWNHSSYSQRRHDIWEVTMTSLSCLVCLFPIFFLKKPNTFMRILTLMWTVHRIRQMKGTAVIYPRYVYSLCPLNKHWLSWQCVVMYSDIYIMFIHPHSLGSQTLQQRNPSAPISLHLQHDSWTYETYKTMFQWNEKYILNSSKRVT